jgi:hypothetical protein
MKPVALLRWILAALAAGAFVSQIASAQTPARFYWATLSDANAVPVLVNSISGNTNPFDPARLVLSPDAKLDATMAFAGYARTLTLWDRSAIAAVLVPMGRVSGGGTVLGRTFDESANGFGDPMVEFILNVVGPPAQKALPDVLRYEPGFSVDVLADLAIPIGRYDDEQPLNLGQNRWYGRIGAPVVWQLGPWVPGRRTTLELLPALWWFGPNTNFVGQRLESDPLFQLDAHVTHDFTPTFWGSLDSSWYVGGKATLNGVAGESLNNFGVGATLGYTINDNLALTVGYKSTVNDKAPDDLRMGNFSVSLVYGWHSLVEGVKRLKHGE